MVKDGRHGTGIGQRELQMSARALLDLFGGDAPDKARERAGVTRPETGIVTLD